MASLLGAALLAVPASYYRITRTECSAQFSPREHLLACAVYLLAIALLALGWMQLARTVRTERRSIGLVIGLGTLVHLVALLALPFLSRDPLFYAALGRAAAQFSAGPFVALCNTLPADDRFAQLLSPAWRCGTSAYGSGFNQLTAIIGQLAGDRLELALRLYQFVGLLTMAATAALAGLAAQATDRERGSWAAALVLFSPLAVIEGTVSAHNDGFLALATAGFAFLLTRRRPVLAGLALCAGFFIKLSAALLAGFYLVRQAMRGAQKLGQSRSRGLGITVLTLGIAVTAIAVFWCVRAFWPWLRTPAHAALALVGNSSAGYCTRSVECMPRALLFFVAHAEKAAWIVGVFFRLLAGLFLLYTAKRAAKTADPLPWAAIFFFFYFLYLHGYMQSWYFLPLLPLLFALPAGRVQRAAFVLCVSAVAYYVLYIPLYCAFGPQTPLLVSMSEFGQAAVVIIPPTVALLWRRSF